jgi:hypothetical protein
MKTLVIFIRGEGRGGIPHAEIFDRDLAHWDGFIMNTVQHEERDPSTQREMEDMLGTGRKVEMENGWFQSDDCKQTVICGGHF